MNTGTSIYEAKGKTLPTYNTTQGNQALSNLARIQPTLNADVPSAIANLGPGLYPGGIRTAVRWVGIGAFPRIVSALALDGSCFLTGLQFDEVVTLAATASVQFSNCIFNKPINVVAGGRCSVVGSRLDGTAAVLNAGAPANSQSIGNIKTSGVANTNTVTIEV